VTAGGWFRPHAPMLAVMLGLAAGVGGEVRPVMATADEGVLRATLDLSDKDMANLARGRPVVKTLSSPTRREVATGGAIRIRGSIPCFVEQFLTLEGFRRSDFVQSIARFSYPPLLTDLDPLSPEPDDIDDLRKCKVGDCKVRLPAADIRRFQTEVDWRAPDWRQAASELLKRTLFGYLTSYRAGGFDRLPAYDDDDKPLRVAEELRALIRQSPSPLDVDPGFREYMLQYPAGTLSGTEDFFYWSKESFGFKPIVGLNHVSVHRGAGGLVSMAIIQIHTTHYIDGQVAAMTLLPVPGDDQSFYWLYLNRARIDRLDGIWGILARPIVQRRARSGLSKSFATTKEGMESNLERSCGAEGMP